MEDIDLEVRAGEILTLFGPSGAGKTTIACVLAGIDRPEVAVSGEIRRGNSTRIGFLPQYAAATLNPARRIGAALGELVGLHHARPERRRDRRALRRELVAQALSAAGFQDDAGDRITRRFPHEFSGGERARLALAQVLACEPDVVVVDEPTVGLDPIARAALLSGLVALRRSGKAVVLVTHDRLAVAQISDRTVFARRGRLVEDEPADPPASARPARSPVGEPVLRVRNVSVTLRNSAILHEIDLDLRRGELVGMIGASGAGKTTIARCVAGLVGPSAGSIELDGDPIPVLRKRSRAQIAAVQYVWQESAASFEPRRTVLDQVAATAVRLRGLDWAAAREQAAETLHNLEITADQAARHPTALSGGQLQRAALARALLAHPRVLICDEITTALDHPLAQRILTHLDRIRHNTGTAVLLITHDPATHLNRADRLTMVSNGRILATGTPQDLLAARPAQNWPAYWP
ncbi:ABC transporter ATP-binding protein [Nocardia macrotermitis]|uniref:ABC transporter ATP-binding protein n=1 Tax=Nocardia macrotermitis TaxID=2585198 RepID=UPI001885BEB7|nr:ATP-binding cassette domain-containing protein [Nocardia macrotermitis]